MCPARLTVKLSTPYLILSILSPTSATAWEGGRKSRPINKGRCFEGTTLKTISAFSTSTNNWSRHSDRRDQCATITKFVSLSFTSFIDLVCLNNVLQQNLAICPPVRASDAEETSCVDDVALAEKGFPEVARVAQEFLATDTGGLSSLNKPHWDRLLSTAGRVT